MSCHFKTLGSIKLKACSQGHSDGPRTLPTHPRAKAGLTGPWPGLPSKRHHAQKVKEETLQSAPEPDFPIRTHSSDPGVIPVAPSQSNPPHLRESHSELQALSEVKIPLSKCFSLFACLSACFIKGGPLGTDENKTKQKRWSLVGSQGLFCH